jgi:hypothetical protein
MLPPEARNHSLNNLLPLVAHSQPRVVVEMAWSTPFIPLLAYEQHNNSWCSGWLRAGVDAAEKEASIAQEPPASSGCCTPAGTGWHRVICGSLEPFTEQNLTIGFF